MSILDVYARSIIKRSQNSIESIVRGGKSGIPFLLSCQIDDRIVFTTSSRYNLLGLVNSGIREESALWGKRIIGRFKKPASLEFSMQFS